MVRRKGEMSTFQIDNGWPFQVALPEAVSLGKANDVVRDFCAYRSVRAAIRFGAMTNGSMSGALLKKSTLRNSLRGSAAR
jgi:hypothetical protein